MDKCPILSPIKQKYCEDFREISLTPLIVTVRHAQLRQARHSCVCRSVLDYTVDIGELSERHRVSVVLTGLIITQNRQTRTEGRRETPTESRQDVLILLNTSCSYFCYCQYRHVVKTHRLAVYLCTIQINPTSKLKHKYQFHYEIYHTVNRLRCFLSLGHSVTRSLGHLVTWSLGHLVTWSLFLYFQHCD